MEITLQQFNIQISNYNNETNQAISLYDRFYQIHNLGLIELKSNYPCNFTNFMQGLVVN